MLAEVARVLKLHPQFIHGLCPRNNQSVEQPERRAFTLPRVHTHTHTNTHAQMHSHTFAHVRFGNGKKVMGEWGEDNWPNTLRVGTCTHVTQHCHGNSIETSRQTIHKHRLYLCILHF